MTTKPCPHRESAGSHVRCGLVPDVQAMSLAICSDCQAEWPGGLPPTLLTLPGRVRELVEASSPEHNTQPIERKRPCQFLGEALNSRPCCQGKTYWCSMHRRGVRLGECRACPDYEATC